MLFQTLPIFGNTWCTNSFLISKFLKGVFNTKPPLPKYKFIWDVSVVIKYLESLFPLCDLSLKTLTLKLTALIALATAPRAQTLASLNLQNMKIDTVVTFYFPMLLKTSKNDKFVMKLEHYKNERLCVFHTLLHYIERTKDIRKSQQLLISFVSFRAVSTDTIARWLRTVLCSAGIDVSVFKAHSFRSASTSAAYRKGCSVKDILQTADWKSDKNFIKFYRRECLNKNDTSYINAVFDK